MYRNMFHHRDVPFLLLLALSCAFIYGSLTLGHDWGGDDFASYIMQAQSLLDGTIPELIEQNNLTIKESSGLHVPVTYPWGFPVLLAPVYSAFGANIVWLKSVGILFFILFLVTLYYGFSRYHPRGWILGMTAVFAFSPPMLRFLNNILSDVPFLFCSTLSVLLIGRIAVRRHTMIAPLPDHLILGVLIAVTYFIRTSGILLLMVLASTQLLTMAVATCTHRRKGSMQESSGIAEQAGRCGRAACLVTTLSPYASFLLCVVLWRIWLPTAGDSYFTFLELITPASILNNIQYYAKLPKYFFGNYPIYAASIPFVFLGIRDRYKTDYHILLYVALVVALHIIWPFHQGLRFIYPVLPFYVSFAFTGIQYWSESFTFFGTRIDIRYVSAVLTVMILFYVATSLHGIYQNLSNGRQDGDGPYTAEASEMLRFVRDHTAHDDIIMFEKPRIMRLMTGRMSAKWRNWEDVVRGNYLVINMNSPFNKTHLPGLQHFQQRKVVFENPHFLVIRILPASGHDAT